MSPDEKPEQAADVRPPAEVVKPVVPPPNDNDTEFRKVIGRLERTPEKPKKRIGGKKSRQPKASRSGAKKKSKRGREPA